MRLYPELTQQEEFDSLRTQGYTGSLNDMQYAWLSNVGAYSGSLTDMHKGWASDTLSDYVVAGYVPTVADFVAEAYFDAGVSDTFAGLLAFTRASSATYVDASGVLQTATTDTPRFTYDPLTGEKLGLMREAAATNLILRSEEFGTLPWTTFGASVSANAATAPDGNATADKVVESVGGTNHQVAQLVTLAAGREYATSVWVKAAGRDYVAFAVTSPGMAQRDLTVLLTTGEVTYDDLGGSSSVEGFVNGWYRIKFTYTTVTGGLTTIRIRPSNGPLQADQTYSGDGTSGVYVWGAQCEAGAVATSYIATAGATATRAAETIQIPAANLPTPPSGGAWVVQMDGVMSFADNNSDATVRPWLRIAAGNTNNFLADVDTDGTKSGTLQVGCKTPLGSSITASETFTPGVDVPFNIAGLYSANRTQGAYGGNLLTAVTRSNGIPTFTIEPLLIMPNGNAIIKKIRIFTDYVSDAVLAEMTT